MYIFANSQQNMDSYPDNTSHNFHVTLPRPLNLPTGKWKWFLCLKELVVQRVSTLDIAFILTVDCITNIATYGTEDSALRTIHLTPSRKRQPPQTKDILIFDTAYYIPLHTGLINSLHVQLKALEGGPLTDIVKVWCVFHFKRDLV